MIWGISQQPSWSREWQLTWGSSSQSRTFVTPSVLCSQLRYVTRNRHMWKHEVFFKQWSIFGPQAALWGHSDNTSLLKRDFSDFIWLVVGRWQNDRRFIDNSSHEKWVFSTVPLLSLPPVLFLSQMMCPCGLEDCRDVKPAGCFRSPTNFCLSEKAAAALVTLWRGKSGACKSHQSKVSFVMEGGVSSKSTAKIPPPPAPWRWFSTLVCGLSYICSAKFLLGC